MKLEKNMEEKATDAKTKRDKHIIDQRKTGDT